MTRRWPAIRGCPLFEYALGGEMTGECAATALDAVDFQAGPVAMQRMLDDGQSQPRPGGLARAARVDTIKALGQARQMLRRDSGPRVPHGEMATLFVRPPPDVHAAVRRRVF